jgi:protein SCO1/2
MNGLRAALLLGIAATLAAGILTFDRPARLIRWIWHPAVVPAVPSKREFLLIDDRGKPVSVRDFRGRWLIVYFGFTQCPDLCSAAMLTLSSALRSLGPDAERLQAAFVTIDPEHDTADVLTRYLANFGSGIVGLTGTPAQIAAAAASFGAYARPAEQGGSPAASIMHSSTLYLLDPEGNLNRQLSTQITADELARYLRRSTGTDWRAANRQ